jgi:hypothetical protein
MEISPDSRKSPIFSPWIEIQARDSQHRKIHADPLGNTRGSKNTRQADNALFSGNKPETGFKQKEDLENKFVYLSQDPHVRD